MLKRLVDRAGARFNRAVLRLLDRAGGRTVDNSLDDLIGTWTDEEAREFEQATAELRGVNRQGGGGSGMS
jgi:hypothetical protein